MTEYPKQFTVKYKTKFRLTNSWVFNTLKPFIRLVI